MISSSIVFLTHTFVVSDRMSLCHRLGKTRPHIPIQEQDQHTQVHCQGVVVSIASVSGHILVEHVLG